ncbi:MAG: CoB--CoM heterodisulfide reductase iron-sulfur subunit B family protein [Thermoguttaceae bacterium]|nr:CoB--CoM heterodisulfide reductase iron-sulfur subunit B family protein [Thermoguttaceae bacterium]
MKIGYYPGCALHGSSLDYEQSVLACLAKLGVELEELDDWICCGATAAHSLNEKLATALPVRNLGIAEKMNLAELFAPCPMCSMELLKAKEGITKSVELRQKMSEIVELPLVGSTEIFNLIQVFQKVGIDQIVAKQTQKLEEFRPACYYGCLLTRPPKVVRFDDCEHPESMETLLKALGASPVDWNYKTECCGAGMTLCDAETVVDLSHKIIANAEKHGANCLVTACPMCQMNLDMRQSDVRKKYPETTPIPIYYLSDLVGLAVGVEPKELGVHRHFEPCPLR